MRILGIILIIAGVIALGVGSFSYTQDKTVAKLGSLEVDAKQTKTIDLPVWGGVGAIVAGVLLVALSGRRR
jgi:3-hydroxyisobutyrate dehydrogenase-like beta-hydroxyacid dehydrogenase